MILTKNYNKILQFLQKEDLECFFSFAIAVFELVAMQPEIPC